MAGIHGHDDFMDVVGQNFNGFLKIGHAKSLGQDRVEIRVRRHEIIGPGLAVFDAVAGHEQKDDVIRRGLPQMPGDPLDDAVAGDLFIDQGFKMNLGKGFSGLGIEEFFQFQGVLIRVLEVNGRAGVFGNADGQAPEYGFDAGDAAGPAGSGGRIHPGVIPPGHFQDFRVILP
jgi:hypothetical protein